MSTGNLCTRAVFASPLETVYDAACRMLDHNIDTLVIIDANRRPIGLLTDRDIVLRCVAQNRWAAYTALEEVMTTALRTVPESMPVDDALRIMQSTGLSRLIVMADDGEPTGIIALDDMVERPAEDGAGSSGGLPPRDASALSA